jgi:hypothetical protein
MYHPAIGPVSLFTHFEMGIINGYVNGKLGVNDKIIKAKASAMLANALILTHKM